MGKSLVIVESPAKARTIRKFLDKDFIIEASIGHVRDLPEGRKDIPAEYRNKEWAYLGVNVEEDFQPVYIVPEEKSKQIRRLRQMMKEVETLYLATDEDREGEAISWHLKEILKPKIPVKRLVFNEITEEAIRDALAHPREIDHDLVRAQETRRIVDRLYGYDVSPLLWRKVRPRLSAGRVQSVAVRLIVERERERMAFVAASYWDLLASFATTRGEIFQAVLVSLDGSRLMSARDFDPVTGKPKDRDQAAQLIRLDESQARQWAARLQGAEFSIISVEDKPYTTRPFPPFTTSTLQQEANRKLRFTARRTMQVAQSLYETGHITYMRTDSTTLADVAVRTARELIEDLYGKEYLPQVPRVYKTRVKNAQEAHEAIRPAGHPFAPPEELKADLSADEHRLYDLIWKRTVASQMADVRGHRMIIRIEGDGAQFQATGKTIDFPGFLRAYVQGSDDPAAEIADREAILPRLKVEERVTCRELETKSHQTQPPARYTEATLTKTLEELGIGRPSTYAAIIETILGREYVFRRGNALVPAWVAFAVAQLLVDHLQYLVDYQFTAEMEDQLDAISRGELEHIQYLNAFYFGNGQTGLKKQIESKAAEIDPRDVGRIMIAGPEVEETGGTPIYVRVGRYGPFLEHGDRRAPLPHELAPDELSAGKALELLEHASRPEEPLGTCPETMQPVYLKSGRFGPYVQRGAPDEPKPQNASLLKGMRPEEVDLEVALKLLSLPRTLGTHPESGESLTASNGRFGPYVKCGKETRSLPAEMSPLDVTLEQAIELLSQPKKGRAGFGVAREPIKTFGNSPVTNRPIRLMPGRYGPYVTDGSTNASLPRSMSPEEIDEETALRLLAERLEKGATTRPRRKTSPRRSGSRTGQPPPDPSPTAPKAQRSARPPRKSSRS